MPAVGVVFAGVSLAVTAIAGAGTWLRRASRSAEAELRDKATSWERVDNRATLLGFQRHGCLGLSRDSLWFVQWLPRKTVRIPRSDILSVEASARSLQVIFTQDGKTRSLTWTVRDLEGWKTALRS